MKNILNRSAALCTALLLAASVMGGCVKKEEKAKETVAQQTQKEETPADLPVYTAEYEEEFLRVKVNKKDEMTELVVPVPPQSEAVTICNSGYYGCIYYEGYRNVPLMIIAEDFENNVLALVEASDWSDRMKIKFGTGYYVKKDINDDSLSDADRNRMKKDWPITEFTAVYIFDTEAARREVEEISSHYYEIGYDEEACLADLNRLRKVAEDNGVDLDIVHPSDAVLPDNVTKITFSQGVSRIYGVCGCEYTNVETVHIPSSVKVLENDAFEGLEKLTSITYDGTVAEWTELMTVGKGEDARVEDLLVYSDVTVICSDGEYQISVDVEEEEEW